MSHVHKGHRNGRLLSGRQVLQPARDNSVYARGGGRAPVGLVAAAGATARLTRSATPAGSTVHEGTSASDLSRRGDVAALPAALAVTADSRSLFIGQFGGIKRKPVHRGVVAGGAPAAAPDPAADDTPTATDLIPATTAPPARR